jgi:hypothetical protein
MKSNTLKLIIAFLMTSFCMSSQASMDFKQQYKELKASTEKKVSSIDKKLEKLEVKIEKLSGEDAVELQESS